MSLSSKLLFSFVKVARDEAGDYYLQDPPRWLRIDPVTGNVVIDKRALHHEQRRCLRGFNAGLPTQFSFNWSKMTSGLYAELPLRLDDILDLHLKGDSMDHTHTVFKYDGSQGRGILHSHGWEKHFHACGLPVYISVYNEANCARPMSQSRKCIEQYVSNPRKGFVDLDPDPSFGYSVASQIKTAQYNGLTKLQKKAAEGDMVKQYILAKYGDELPEALATIQLPVEEIKKAHADKEHTSKLEWKREFFSTLYAYQIVNYCKTNLGKQEAFEQFMHQVVADAAEKYRQWGWWEFFLSAKRSKCVCNQKKEEANGTSDKLLKGMVHF
jgi:hypothetical protein